MIIVLNNKSNLDKEEFAKYEENLSKIKSSTDLVLAPTTLNIPLFNLSNFSLASQNVSTTQDGAYTGEVSARQLSSYNVQYTIVGHSERREYEKETNKEINSKIKRLLEYNITPILCIGENREERESNKVEAVLKKELIEGIVDLTEEEKEKIIVAYEPIWSIGTGNIPTTSEIEEVFNIIHSILPTNKILYGGSANEKNIEELLKVKNIQGFLLGGISLKPDKLQIFLKLIENTLHNTKSIKNKQ